MAVKDAIEILANAVKTDENTRQRILEEADEEVGTEEDVQQVHDVLDSIDQRIDELEERVEGLEHGMDKHFQEAQEEEEHAAAAEEVE